MDGPTDPTKTRARTAGRIALAGALLTMCLWPWGQHLLREASLLGDDIPRVVDLQLRPLSALLLRPFNEHLAPLFEAFSWLAWQGAGHRLSAAPMAFTVASYLPFVLLLVAVGSLARRMAGSWAAAGVAVAVLALTPAYAEVVFWYSASSFAWALAFTAMAIEAADRSRERGCRRWSVAAAILTSLAPCASGIGLLAGPAALLAGWPRRWRFRELIPSTGAALGTSAYLALAFLAGQDAIIGRSVEESTRLGDSLPWIARAPLYLLASGPLARRNAEEWPAWSGFLAGALVLIAIAIWSARGGPRRLIAASVVLILGGYLSTYPFRVGLFPGRTIFHVGRYHAFPMVGVALLIAAASAPFLAKLERRRTGASATAVLGLALLLMLANRGAIRERTTWHKFPEQAATLRGLDRLAEVCRERGIPRDRAIASLDPVLARWTNPGFNCLQLLPIWAGEAEVADAAVAATIFSSLSARERREAFAGTDVSRELVSGIDWQGDSGVMVDRLRTHPTGRAGSFRHDGWPSYLEYDFAGDSPSAIRLPRLEDREAVQLWWQGPTGEWSADRSVTLAPRGSSPVGNLVLPLARVPHWAPGEARRVRLFFSKKGEVALAAPESVRVRVR